MSEREIITVAEAALKKVLELRADEDDADELALRIEVTGVQGVDFSYDLAFEVLAEADSDDVPTHVGGGLTVLIPERDVTKLEGATLDLPSNTNQPGLVLRNPNRPELGPNASLDLSGTLEEQVREVLVKRINPSIAAHGGFAELVRVEGSTVVVKLGGGCQGCGMANATVTAGIEKTLTELLDGVENVVDITDHASGENPYFANT
ncbi:MAG: NifU family protein [Actinomycetota bacterium]|jgi:Fe/S biogenesis protein NfuA|nr:NifU family protein [Acidimicrobiales bacterium]MEC9338906.1 NifU family protein [Actinomycetota bacterium]|tara:strand:+ start:368 stop:985 length:618 start_codon:yes stop_codon:yes gene_type:complete